MVQKLGPDLKAIITYIFLEYFTANSAVERQRSADKEESLHEFSMQSQDGSISDPSA